VETESIGIPEYGVLYSGTLSEQLNHTEATLSSKDFDEVLNLNEQPENAHLAPVFKFSRLKGRDTLTAQNYVGVVQTSSGCQIEILPKISDSIPLDEARQLLVKMLIELKNANFKEGVLSHLDTHNMPLFEHLLSQFLKHVGDIVRKGIARKYVELEENLMFLRGKLQIQEQIKQNIVDQTRFYCVHDEYERNRPINRLIKGALEIVQRVSKSYANRLLSREYLYWFDQVPATQNFRNDFRAINQDRFIHHYRKALPICRMILERLNPLTKQGRNKCLSVLFDMNKVFEDYVASKIQKKYCPPWKIQVQVRSEHLVVDHDGNPLFRLKPDLELRKDNTLIIADTKWKLIDENKRPYDITSTDLYQIFTYAKKYLEYQPVKVVVLISPATDNFKRPLKPFWFNSQQTEVLIVLPYDLQRDELVFENLKNFDWEMDIFARMNPNTSHLVKPLT